MPETKQEGRERELCDSGIGHIWGSFLTMLLPSNECNWLALAGGTAEPILGLSFYGLSSSSGRNAHYLPPIHR